MSLLLLFTGAGLAGPIVTGRFDATTPPAGAGSTPRSDLISSGPGLGAGSSPNQAGFDPSNPRQA